MTIVMKFGGTSMSDAESIRGCASLVREHGNGHQVVTVVSAMAGVTDLLLELADAAAAGNRAVKHTLLGGLRAKHEESARTLGVSERVHEILDRLERLVSGIEAVGELTLRSRDAVVSFGETLSSALMASAIDGVAMTGGEAGIVTDEQHGEAEPLMQLSLHLMQERLGAALSRDERVVVTGFVAATQHGAVSTLGRGGSDYTATLIGAALHADEIWIWTDVDGLMTADPRIVSNARLLESIAFDEAVEMGQFGAKSMHPRALEPAAEHGIAVRVRNTFNAACEGTLISSAGETSETMRSVLLLKGSALVTVSGAAMVGRPGTAAKVFAALGEAGVNVQMISQTVSEAGISLVVAGSQLDRARTALAGRLLRTKSARSVDVIENAAVVAAVGSKMHGQIGVAARVFGSVAKRGLNILAIAQGSSERSICFVVDGESGPEAVRALHDAFELGAS